MHCHAQPGANSRAISLVRLVRVMDRADRVSPTAATRLGSQIRWAIRACAVELGATEMARVERQACSCPESERAARLFAATPPALRL